MEIQNDGSATRLFASKVFNLTHLMINFRDNNGSIFYKWNRGLKLEKEEEDKFKAYLRTYYTICRAEGDPDLEETDLESMFDQLLLQGMDPLL